MSLNTEKSLYSAASVANAFLSKSFDKKKTISPMKIQKLIYFANGFYLAEQDKPLVNEVFEAWRFGPVLNSLYHQCKYFNKNGISKYLGDFDSELGKLTPAPFPEEESAMEVIEYVWREFGDVPAMALSKWTHHKGGPWDVVTNGGTQTLLHQEVPNAAIKEYFENRMYKQ